MTAAQRLDRDEVVAALRPADVLAHYQIAGKELGHEFRTRLCPKCGPRSRDSVTINLTTGGWSDHAHGCRGGVLDLIAGLQGLELPRELNRVLEIAANIAGVGPDTSPERRAELEAKRRAEEEALERKRAAERSRAEAFARRVWHELERTSLRGEHYLRGRGVDATELLARDLVRWGQNGDVCVALWKRGNVVNVVRRVIDAAGDAPKVRGVKDCGTEGTLVGQTRAIGPGALVVVTEGVVDTLVAHLAWPGAVVLGAHGASRFGEIAAVAAQLLARHETGDLLLVGHDDKAGHDALDKAMRGAIEAGLVTMVGDDPASRVRAVDLGGHNDLADAWRAGWRP